MERRGQVDLEARRGQRILEGVRAVFFAGISRQRNGVDDIRGRHESIAGVEIGVLRGAFRSISGALWADGPFGRQLIPL